MSAEMISNLGLLIAWVVLMALWARENERSKKLKKQLFRKLLEKDADVGKGEK